LPTKRTTVNPRETLKLKKRIQTILAVIEKHALTSELRPETQHFLDTLHIYLDCYQQMDAKYLEDHGLQRIASYQLKTDSGGIETDSKDPFEFKAEYQQQSVAGKPVKTIDEF
jgi:Holliday junction resolvasome RuvABC ATP-dependent DNA helicase subunit